jgi:hypothetical protein
MKHPFQSICDIYFSEQHSVLSDILCLSTGKLITASRTEVLSPQIKEQQAAKLSGETLHWKDTTQKKQRKGSKQDATADQSTPTVDAEKTQGSNYEYK